MAHYRLGHREEAKKWLEKFNQEDQTKALNQSSNWFQRVECQLLRAEAEALVNGNKP
jgi:hypothetical protein